MRLVALGAGESGVGAAVLAKKEGYDVFVSDAGTISEKYRTLLTQHDIPFEDGGHTESLVLNADEIVKSPGIPEDAPMVKAVREKGIPVISEIEFAARYTDAKMICITGSNGKTTTTSWIFHIMKKAGTDVGLAGNIGRSLALQVAEDPHACYVIELSSFQLDDMFDFRADIAVLLNITPDHLDRYNFELQNYVDSKMRITRNQRPSDSFIYWQNDDHVPEELHRHPIGGTPLPFSDAPENGSKGFIQDGVMRLSAPAEFEMPVADISLIGRHNLRNAMAAAMACLAAGVPASILREGLADFPGVPHRLEKVCTVGGAFFINDSKATNVDACRVALEAVAAPVILILGGKDKGNDYSAIMDLVKEKCKALVFLGADNSKLQAVFKDCGLPICDTDSISRCVFACCALSHPGDTVLLSPCCASFDLFNGMAERGNLFKEWAHRMKQIVDA